MFRLHLTIITGVVIGITIFTATLSPAKTVDKVLAVVNDQIITFSELEERKQKLISEMSRMVNPSELEDRISEVEAQTLELMIEEILMEQRADQLSIKVDDQSVTDAIQNVMAANKIDSEEQLDRALRTEGLSLADYKSIIQAQLKIFRVQNYEVKSKVRIIDDEVRAFYEQHRAEFTTPYVYSLRHIFLKKSDLGDNDAIAAKAEAIYDQLKSNVDFCTLAKTKSEDLSTNETCGDLGQIQQKDLLPQFTEALREAQEGDILPPFETPNGWHVVNVVTIIGGKPKSYEDMAEAIREKLFQDKFLRKRMEWLEELKKSSYIKIIGTKSEEDSTSEK